MSKMMDRRGFGRTCAGFAVAAVVAPVAAGAADLPMVDEADAQAKALGYHADASTIDKAKFANFVDGSLCAHCVLFQGAAAPTGPCGLFPGKAVSAKGWCSAFAKKPG